MQENHFSPAFSSTLPAAVKTLLKTAPGPFGLSLQDLKSDRCFAQLGDEIFTQASAIKIPILWELHRAAHARELSLDELLAVCPADGAGGCGVLQNFAEGKSQLALGDLAVMMIILSDNVATNQLIDRVTREGVNRLLESQGTAETRLRRKMMDQASRDAGRENTATPNEAVQLMATLYHQAKQNDPVATGVLKTLLIRKESPVTDALANRAKLANKPGQLDGLRTDWALVEQSDHAYAMALMAEGPDDKVLKRLFEDVASAIHEAMVA